MDVLVVIQHNRNSKKELTNRKRGEICDAEEGIRSFKYKDELKGFKWNPEKRSFVGGS